MSDQEPTPLTSFDQTNGLAGNLEGESDGSADAEERSEGDRNPDVHPRPVGAQDTFRTDHYGEKDGVDPDP